MNINCRITVVLFVALLAFCEPSGFSQQQTQAGQQSKAEQEEVSPLSYQLEVGLIQIPIRVEDKKGHWINGIQKSDLTLLEDGVPQEIRYIDEMDLESEQPQLETPKAPTTAIDVLNIPEAKMNRIRSNSLILIVDGCNTGQTALATHKQYVHNFLSNYDIPNTLFSLIFIRPSGDYVLTQNFTSNKSDVLRALEDLRGSTAGYESRIFASSQIADSSQVEDCAAIQNSSSSLDCAEQALRTVVRKANAFAEEEHTRSKNTIASLQDIFTKTQHVPGKKNVLFISEGLDPAGSFYYNFAANVIEHFVDHYGLPPQEKNVITDVKLEANRYVSDTNSLRDLIKSASAADLSIFWVNPQYGKRIEDISSEVTSMRAFDSKLINAPDMDAMMRDIAESTGGAALTSTDMKGFYDRLNQDLRKYYLISYKPPRALNDGRFHKIEVHANREDVKVLYKKDLKDATIEDRINNELAAALDFPQASTSFSMLSDVTYFMKSGTNYQVMAKIGIPYRDMEPQVGDQGVRNEIHFSYLVRNEQGDIVSQQNPILRLSSQYSEFEQLKKSGTVLEYLQTFDLSPGIYNISLAVMDVAGWKTAGDAVQIKLPGRTETCVSVSPPMLAGQIKKSDSVQKNPTPTAKGEMIYGQYVFGFPVHRVFPQKGNLTGFYQIYNAKFPCTIRFKLYKDKTVFVNQTPETQINDFTDAPDKLITNFFSVPYNNLAPGSYELEIMVKSPTCTSSTRSEFEVIAQGS